MGDKRTMTLNLTEREMDTLEALAAKKDLSKTAIVRQALRLYQLVEDRVDEGAKLVLENDKTNQKSELMVL